MSRPTLEERLSAAHTAKGRLQRELLERLRVHERDGTLPTSNRFLFYELVQAGVVSKHATGARRADQGTIDALTHLRETGLVPWDWIEDETRTLDEFETAPSVAAYVTAAVAYASIDRWGGQPAPLILCESRSLAGVLRATADDYACYITSTNGQTKGFLVTDVAPYVQEDQRMLYFGDLDLSAGHIEENTLSVLTEYGAADPELWERVAITPAQVAEVNRERAAAGLGDATIMKTDKRYRNADGSKGKAFPAVETEVFGQARIVEALRTRLDELMPEPLADVLERQDQQRARVAAELRRFTRRTQT